MVVLVPSGLVDQVLGHLDLVGQIHHAEGQVLVLVQRLLELLTDHQVLPGDLESALSNTQSLGGDADAAAVQGLQRGGEAHAGRCDHVGHGDMDVVEVELADHGGTDAHGVVAGADGEAGGVALHHEGGHALGAGLMVGQGIDGEVVRQRAVGDEALVAVDDELIAHPLGKGLQTADVGAGIGLGQAEGTEMTVVDDGRHEPLELLVGGIGEVQGAAVQRGGDGVRDGQGGVNLGDLLDGQGIFHVAQVLAAVFLGIGQAYEAQIGQFLVQAHVVLAGLVPLQDLGGDLLLGEVTGQLLDLQLLFSQFEIHKYNSFYSVLPVRPLAYLPRTPSHPAPRSGIPYRLTLPQKGTKINAEGVVFSCKRVVFTFLAFQSPWTINCRPVPCSRPAGRRGRR